MARIDIKSGGTILNDGVLQLGNGVAMDATLRNVADQNNTTSPLKLSTTAVQVESPLRITTSDASGFYIDAEDSATNNRFSVKRDPSSQLVTIDFASNPSGSTTAVGAIRTYVDGVNLSEVMTFREDGNVGIGTNAPIGILQVKTTQANTNGSIVFSNNSAATILALTDTGSALTQLQFRASSYNFTDTAGMRISSGGYGNVATAMLQVVGSGSTSATTSLLVQNSSAFQLLKVTDDGQCQIGGNGLTTFPLQVYGNSGLQIQVGNTFFSYEAVRTIRFLNANNGIPLNHEIVNQVSSTDNSNYVYFRNQGTSTAGSNPEWKGISIETIVQTQTSAIATQLSITPTLNLAVSTTTASIQRGIYYNPTITNLRVAQHYAWQNTSGAVIINSSTPDASAILQADSTTQGFLPPRMTDAQIRAIATPAEGLVAYNTTISHLCCYQAGAWVKFSHTPM